MAGRIDKQIGVEMGISLGTVRVYWKRIRLKVGGTRSEVITELARNSMRMDLDGARDQSEKLSLELQESARRERDLRLYEIAFAHLAVAVAIVDAPTGGIIHTNRPFASMHGYETDELIGASCEDLMVPDEVAEFDRLAHLAAERGQRFAILSTRRRKDGRTFPSQAQLIGAGDAWVLELDAAPMTL